MATEEKPNGFRFVLPACLCLLGIALVGYAIVGTAEFNSIAAARGVADQDSIVTRTVRAIHRVETSLSLSSASRSPAQLARVVQLVLITAGALGLALLTLGIWCFFGAQRAGQRSAS